MKLYVARDMTGELYLYNFRPLYDRRTGCFGEDGHKITKPFDMLKLSDAIFQNVKRGETPKEVIITLAYCQESGEKEVRENG